MDIKIYKQFRAAGYRAKDALSAARVVRRFNWLAGKGLVRVSEQPDEEPYDDSYIDTWDNLSDGRKARIKKDICAAINEHGVWGFVGEFNMFGQWVPAGSCWGFIGNELENNKYRISVMDETIDAFRKYLQTRCRHCMGTGVNR